jgi:hypothetical protein
MGRFRPAARRCNWDADTAVQAESYILRIVQRDRTEQIALTGARSMPLANTMG